MDTLEKYNLKKNKAILLFAQMIILIIGTAISAFVFAYITKGVASGNYNALMLISSLAMLLAHIAIIIYGCFGFRKGRTFFLGACAIFAFAIVVNVLITFRTPFQHILLTLMFGYMLVFIVKEHDRKFAAISILIVTVLSLVFSISSAIVANPHALGDSNIKVFTILAMYASLFAPTVLAGTIALIHAVHMDQEEK